MCKRGGKQMKSQSEGTCGFCKKTFSSAAMSRHLRSCNERKKVQEREKKAGKIYLLRAQAGPFFVYFEVKGSATLKDVDAFLRRLWLECCGHLSAFTIDDVRYEQETDGVDAMWEDFFGKIKPPRSMNSKVSAVLQPGLKFIHEYDFGSITQLDMQCISERQGTLKKIKVLARNHPPKYACISCGKPAKEICVQCQEEGPGFLCEACAKKHKCGEEMLLPVVNSPRMGVCGYTGEEDPW